MITVWKFPIRNTEFQEIYLPKDSKILSANIQNDVSCIWAEVDSEQEEKVSRKILLVKTGTNINSSSYKFVGTLMFSEDKHIKHLFEFCNENNTKISKPDILNKSILKTYDNIIIDKIIGTIYGNAIGDAIGLGTEFMTKKQIEYYYPNGFNSYNQIISDKHRSNWQPGEWTDDTDQMLCILDTILKYKTVDIKDIAKNIHNWAHSGGKGIGQHTYKVITNSMFKSDPHKVSKKVWLDSDKRSAANGAVMRTSILGIWDHDDIGKVMYNTKQAAKVTHCDPRCIGSCIAVTTTISNILQGENDFNKLLEPAKKIAAKYDDRINEYLEYSKAEDIAALELDEDKSIGYTLKAIAAGFWALKHIDFKEAILKIVNQGGDADTNAAVAGAMLGAKLGYSNLPKDWIDGLLNKHKLNGKINQLIDIMKEEGQIG